MTRPVERSARPHRRLALLALLLGAAGPALAQAPQPAAAGEREEGYGRPTGPIEIEAQTADILRDGTAIYQGGVQVRSSEFELSGDRMELRQPAERQYRLLVTGAPAHFAHAGGGADAPPVDATAQRIEYDSGSNVIELSGDVRVLRGRDRLSTERLRYELDERRIQASGGTEGQVRITIDPDRPDDAGDAEAQP